MPDVELTLQSADYPEKFQMFLWAVAIVGLHTAYLLETRIVFLGTTASALIQRIAMQTQQT